VGVAVAADASVPGRSVQREAWSVDERGEWMLQASPTPSVVSPRIIRGRDLLPCSLLALGIQARRLCHDRGIVATNASARG
jgi:hypothetical protein